MYMYIHDTVALILLFEDLASLKTDVVRDGWTAVNPDGGLRKRGGGGMRPIVNMVIGASMPTLRYY